MRFAGYVLVLPAALALTCPFLLRDGGAATRTAAERDQVVRAAQRQIAVLNSMNPADVDTYLARWLESSTGLLHDELARGMAANKIRFRAARDGGRGQVTAVAVTALDAPGGQATVIASVRIHPLAGGADRRQRYQAGMERTAAGWKLSSITPVQPPAGRGRRRP